MTQEFEANTSTSSDSTTLPLPDRYLNCVPFIGFGVGGLAFGFSNACVGIESSAVIGALSQQAFCVLVACVVYSLHKRLRLLSFEVICASLVVAALSLLPFLFIDNTAGQLIFIGCHAVQFIALAVFFIGAFDRESTLLSGRRIAVAIAWSFGGVGVGWALSAATLYTAGLSSVFLHAATSVVIAALIIYALVSVFTAMRTTRRTQTEASAENHATEEDLQNASNATAEPLKQACLHLARQANLSRREEQVLMLLSHGKSAGDIATELVVSGNTVKTHVRNVYRKLGVHSREELDHLLAVDIENNQQNRQIRTGTSIESNHQKTFM